MIQQKSHIFISASHKQNTSPKHGTHHTSSSGSDDSSSDSSDDDTARDQPKKKFKKTLSEKDKQELEMLNKIKIPKKNTTCTLFTTNDNGE